MSAQERYDWLLFLFFILLLLISLLMLYQTGDDMFFNFSLILIFFWFLSRFGELHRPEDFNKSKEAAKKRGRKRKREKKSDRLARKKHRTIPVRINYMFFDDDYRGQTMDLFLVVYLIVFLHAYLNDINVQWTFFLEMLLSTLVLLLFMVIVLIGYLFLRYKSLRMRYAGDEIVDELEMYYLYELDDDDH